MHSENSWCISRFHCASYGFLGIRISGFLDIRKSGFPEIRISGYQDIRKSGNPDIRISGSPDFRNSRYPDIRKSGYPDVRNSGYPDFRMFGNSDIWKSGYPDFLISGCPEIRRCEKIVKCMHFTYFSKMHNEISKCMMNYQNPPWNLILHHSLSHYVHPIIRPPKTTKTINNSKKKSVRFLSFWQKQHGLGRARDVVEIPRILRHIQALLHYATLHWAPLARREKSGSVLSPGHHTHIKWSKRGYVRITICWTSKLQVFAYSWKRPDWDI